MPIDDLTSMVQQRVEDYRWTGDREVILGAGADREARALWRSVRAVDRDTASAGLDAQFRTASLSLGWLHYWRYREAAGERGRAELARALLCLEPVSDDARAVPADLAPLVGRFTDPDAQADTALALLRPSASASASASASGPEDPAASGPEDPALLDAGLLLMTAAAARLPGRGRARGALLSHLCLALHRRHRRDGSPADLDRAVVAGEEAVEIASGLDARAPQPRSPLAHAYWSRYRLAADPADLTRAIDLFEQVLALTGPDVTLLSDLGQAHRQRYEHTGEPVHGQRAVALAEQAVALSGGRAGPGVLADLSTALLRRYERSGARSDLWRAAELGEQAVAALPKDDPENAVHLAAAASALLKRHEHSGAAEDVDRAVDLTEQALDILPEEDDRRPDLLSRLAVALHQRYVSAGDEADVHRAAVLSGWALAALPAGHPGRDRVSMDLAAIHLTRYTHGGVLADIGRAIDLAEEVLARSAARPPEWLSMLGSAFHHRFTVTGADADLDRAVVLSEEALAATGDHDPALAGRQFRLAAAYRRRHGSGHGHEGSRTDLDRAIGLGEQAVARTPDDHIDLPYRLSGLAAARLDRYRLDRTPADVDAAVGLARRALASVAAEHPGRCTLTADLCLAHLERVTGGGASPDAAPDATLLHELAGGVTGARTATAVDRVSAHHAVGALAHAVGQHRLAVTMLDAAAALLPAVAPREAGWADQQHRLGEHIGLVQTGVSAHCAVGDPAGAVELAELGRGVLLAGQANTRVDLAGLEDRNPRLADRFRWVCERLNTPHFPDHERKRWWADYDTLLAGIRALPGLEDFLASPRLSDLRPAAAGGCVVLVNAGGHGGHAVVVRADADPVTVELPDLTRTEADARVEALLAAVNSPPSLAGALRRGRVVPEVLGWLWDTAAGPVVDALGLHREGPRRVWWLPTGALGLLPFHAAGHPGQQGALDTMVSSYAPSLRALREARNRPPALLRRGLTVALRHTPGLSDLPGAEGEAGALGGTELVDGQATADRVLSALERANWAHFACHAVADPASQAYSGLRLHDRTLRLPEIGGLRLADAELAYLSACSTADHGTRYADEVLHLASAFQLAGFRHVVASLWPLADDIAVEAARTFYGALPDTPVADEAATVLRDVTLRLRDEHPDRPDLWAPLVHSGP